MQALYAESCLEAYGLNSGDTFEIFPFNIMLNAALSVIFLFIELIVLVDKKCRSPSSQCMRYGIPSAPSIILACRLGLILNLTIIVQYYLFWFFGHQDAACMTQGFPLVQLIIVVIVFVLAAFNLVQFFTRHTLAEACVSVFPLVDASQQPLCVASVGTGRGFYATAIGGALQKMGLKFEMNGVDHWKGEEAWFEGNMAREQFTAHVVHASSRLNSIALASSSQDVSFAPFLPGLSAVGNSLDNQKTVDKRMYKILWEMCRITKGGGLVLTWVSHSQVQQVVRMFERMGCTENIRFGQQAQLRLGCTPVTLVYATVSSPSCTSTARTSSSPTDPDTPFVLLPHLHNDDEKPSYWFIIVLTTLFLFLGFLYVVLGSLTDESWDIFARYPEGVPYDQRVSTLMINNLTYYPLMAYVFFPRLYYVQVKHKNSSRIGALLWAFGAVLVELAMGMTVWTFLFWLPGFLANLALDHVVSQDAMNWICMIALFVFFGGLYLVYSCIQRLQSAKVQPEPERLLISQCAE